MNRKELYTAYNALFSAENESIDKELDALERTAITLDKALYHKLIILRRCAMMDSVPVNMRRKMLAFGNAMTALEGLPVSESTETTLSLWATGQYSFRDGYLQVLTKYHLIEV